MMTYFELAAKNLLRHRARNLLTLVGIASSVVVLYSILSFNEGFMNNLKAELEKTGVHFLVVPAGCPHEVAALVLHGSVIPNYLNNEVEGALARFAGEAIETATPMLVFQRPNEDKNRLDLIYGMDFRMAKNLKPWWQIKGVLPSRDDEVLVGYEIATHDKLGIGDAYQFSPEGKKYLVSGILEKTGAKDDAFLYVSLAEAQRMVGRPGAITAIGVRLKDPASLGATIEMLSKAIAGIQIVTINQIINSISILAAAARVLSLSVAAVAIVISAIGVMNSILMTVLERTQEIGMMRAIGAAKRDIFHLIIKESVVLTIIGGGAGLVVAVFFAPLIEGFVKGFMPYVPQGALITFNPHLAAACFIFVVVLGVVAGLYPAGKAARISPIEAIRS